MKLNPNPMIRSALRFSVIARKLKETGNPGLAVLLKRESSILLRRAFGLWFQIRFGAKWEKIKPWWRASLWRE